MKLMELFGTNIKALPQPQQMLRIRLMPSYKKDIVNFITRVLMMLSGEESGMQRKTVPKRAV